MPEPSHTPRRRVGVYERLRGPADGSPARMLGIGVVVLIILNQSIRDWHSWAHRDAAPTRASGN